MEGLIQPVRRSQAVDEVTHQLVRLITTGQVEEGERLPSEHELSTAFGVSRPVIREALRGLRSLGLVVSRAGSGTYVANRVPHPVLLGYEVEELHEVRLLIEVPGAAMAARRGSEEQLAELRGLVEQMVDCEDRRVYAELDAAFHIALARCSGNSLQVRLVGDLQELIVENSDLVLLADGARRARATSEHREILNALLERDEAAAEAAMLRHLSGASASLGPQLNPSPGQGDAG
ncbi:MAG TPA: FadR/GntR family transcriptional regulator [Thermoleophilaceae bacterium]|nr:FadR/GntR family transcriptional regulator [Thermoleophilaceae bacterium]